MKGEINNVLHTLNIRSRNGVGREIIIGPSTCATYLSPPTVFVNGINECLPSRLKRRYGPKKLWREPT